MRILELGGGGRDGPRLRLSPQRQNRVRDQLGRADRDLPEKICQVRRRVSVITTDFDKLDLPAESFDAIYAFESIGYDVAPNFYPVALESGVRLCPVGRWWRRSAERSRRRSAA
jgi:hypothetical protein